MLGKTCVILINFERRYPFFCSFGDDFSVMLDYPQQELFLLFFVLDRFGKLFYQSNSSFRGIIDHLKSVHMAS